MRNYVLGIGFVFGLIACGGSDDNSSPPGNPYGSEPNTTVVVGAGAGAGTVSKTPSGDQCIQLPSGECVKPQDKCKVGERADVVIDSRGKVVEIVCYPASSTPTPIDGQRNVDLGKENKGVVSIDGDDDGVDVAGDVTSRGNNVTVYGQGPAVSVIGGKVVAEGNNFAMRGVTVKGNVELTGNNAALVLCVVEGDVIIHGNNTVIADCSVLGKIEIVGNNSVLVANEVGKGISLSESKNTVCDSNTAWSDTNGNMRLDPGESGAAISCEKK
jgi:hypothetical protein